MTIWVIGDLDSSEGFRIVKAALKQLKSADCVSRLGFIHIPPTASLQTAHLSTALYHLMSTSALQTISPQQLLDLVDELDKNAVTDNTDKAGRVFSESAQEVLKGTPLHSLTSSGWDAADVVAAADFWKASSQVAKSLDLKTDAPYLLLNGRVRSRAALKLISSLLGHCHRVTLPLRTLPRSRLSNTENGSNPSSTC